MRNRALKLTGLTALVVSFLFLSAPGYAVVQDDAGEPKDNTPKYAQYDEDKGKAPDEKHIVYIQGQQIDKTEGAVTPDKEKDQKPRYVAGKILVKFREGAEPNLALDHLNIKAKHIERVHSIKPAVAKLKKLKTALAGSDEEVFKEAYSKMSKQEKALFRTYKVELPDGMTVEDAIASLKKGPDIEYAEPDYIVSTDMTPNDPLYPKQWALNNIGQDYPASGRYNSPPGTPGCDIDAPKGWDISIGSQDVIVAVIDTGVDYNHRDLNDNMWLNTEEINGQTGVDDDGNGYIDDIRGWDFCNYDNDPIDDHGHGTHCSGIIGAEGNNGLDITGVCWTARIMPLKFLNSGGSGSTSDAVNCVYYAVNNGARVLSNSWGGSGYSQTLKNAIDYACSKNVIFVAAAGNNNSDYPQYPASYDNVIAVAATDSNDKRASFSNYGSYVDIAAPGVDILSLRAEGTSMGTVQPDGETTIASGTSMACPHVAGLIAAVLTMNSDLSVDEVTSYIKDFSDPITTDKPSVSKRINLNKALSNVPGRNFCHITKVEFTGVDRINIFANISLPSLQAVTLKINRTGTEEWTDIPTPEVNTIPLNSDFIIATCQADFVDTPYQLKLECSDMSGNLSTGSFIFTPDNFHIDALENELSQEAGVINAGPVYVRATMLGNTFTSFSVLYGYGKDPQTWFTDGLQILYTGGPCEKTIIAKLDTSYLREDGECTIKLEAAYGDFLVSETKYFYFGKGMHEGWPKSIQASSCVGAYAVDLNGDALKEVITYETNGIYVWDECGNLLTKWRPSPSLTRFNYNQIPLTFAEINPTPGAEIIYCDYYNSPRIGIASFQNNTFNVLNGWPKAIKIDGINTSSDAHGILVEDLEGNGKKNIVFIARKLEANSATMNFKVFLFNADGTELYPDRPIRYSRATPANAGSNWSNPFVCLDLDGDGKKEIIVASYDQNPVGTYPAVYLNAWKLDGTAYVNGGWPIVRAADKLPRMPICELLTGDVNNDGEEEIVFNTLDGVLGIVNKQGSFLYGTPLKFTTNTNIGSSSCDQYLSMSLCDLEKDGYLEIVTSIDNELHVFNYDGTEKDGWPLDLYVLYPSINPMSSLRRFLDISIGDINGDETSEIVCSTNIRDIINGQFQGYKYLMVFDINGNEVKKWKSSGAWDWIQITDRAANLSDIDNDGNLEMLFLDDGGQNAMNTYYMNVWDLDSPGDSSTVDWPRARHDLQRTGRYTTLPDTRGPSVTIISPTPYTAMPSSGFDFTGTAEDLSGIVEIQINIYDNVRMCQTVHNEMAYFDPNTSTWVFHVLPGHVSANNNSIGQDATLEVIAKDSMNNVCVKSIFIGVFAPNRPPVFDSIGNKTIDENRLLKFTISATDPDGDTLTYSATNLPAGASINSSNGLFSWTPTFEQAGTYLVTFTVTDNQLSVYQTVTITVNNVNRPPVLNPIGAKIIAAGQSCTFTISGSDTDGDNLTYSANTLPMGANFDINTNTFTWVPTIAQTGSYPITFTVSDNKLTASETITITVTPPLVVPIPPVLTSVKAVSTNQINITWAYSSNNQIGFKIERRLSILFVNPEQVITVGPNVTYYEDKGLKEGTVYLYQVKAYNEAGDSFASNSLFAVTELAFPTNLAATLTAPTQIKLTWADNSISESAYLIERSLTGLEGSWSMIANIGANATTWTDYFGIAAGTKYYYRVRASKGLNAYSRYTNVVSITTPSNALLAPSNLMVIANTRGSITLSWTDNSIDEAGFAIERCPKTTLVWAQVGNVTFNNTTYTNTGLTPGAVYLYRVKAYNGSIYSGYSNTVTVTASIK